MDFSGEALLLQRTLTIYSAGFNALYFFRYLGYMSSRGRNTGNGQAWSRFQRRKVAVAVLACTNLALLAGGLVPLVDRTLRSGEWTSRVGVHRRAALVNSGLRDDGTGASR